MTPPSSPSRAPMQSQAGRSQAPRSSSATTSTSFDPSSETIAGTSPAFQRSGALSAALSLQRTVGNQAIGRALRAQSPAPAESRSGVDSVTPPRANRSAEVFSSIVARAARYGDLQRSAVVTRAPDSGQGTALVQRSVMTDQQWQERSSRTGRMRSMELLRIDSALAVYNAQAEKGPSVRIDNLGEITKAINAWRATKGNKLAKSARFNAIVELEGKIRAEQEELEGQKQRLVKPESQSEVLASALDLYDRAVHELHYFLAMPVSERSGQAVIGKWKEYRAQAQDIEIAANGLSAKNPQYTTEEKNQLGNATLVARALRHAMRAFRTITYKYLKAKVDESWMDDNEKSKVDLSMIQLRLATLSLDVKNAPNMEQVHNLLSDIEADIVSFASLAGADKEGESKGKGKLAELDGGDSADFDLIEKVIEANDILTTLLGYHAGTGNEGMQDAYKLKPEQGEDKRGKAAQGVAKAMSVLDPKDPRGQDIMLGVSDTLNALGGLGAEALTIYQCVKTLKNPKASDEDKAKARMTLITIGLPTILNTYKMAGGILNIIRAGDQYEQSKGKTGKLAGTGFGFKSDGVDVSTDVKLVSDFAGAFAGIISTIGQVIDYFKWVKEAADDPKIKQGGDRKTLETLGNGLLKGTGVVSSVAGNFQALAKLGYQIAEGGQAVSEKAAAVSSAGGAVPGIQLVYGIMQAIQHAYKLTRLGIRKSNIGEKLEALRDYGAKVDVRRVEAVEAADLTLFKRMARVGINLGHSLASILAGGLTLSGVGTAPGMVIGLSSTALRLGQIGLRLSKQKLRDRSAKKRLEQGKEESYENWKRRKRIEAQNAKFKRFKVAMEIKFTFNWDKSSENKKSTTREVAFEIIRMNDWVILDALGIWASFQKATAIDEKLKIVTDALIKRD